MRKRWMALAAVALLATGAAVAGAAAPKPPTRPVRTTLTAVQHLRVTVGRGKLELDSTVDYTISRGSTATVTLALPADVTVRSVQGTSVQSWAVTSAGRANMLRVQLAAGLTGSCQLWVQGEQPIRRAALGQPVAFAVPTIVPLGTTSESGAVALLGEWGVEVQAGKTEGVTPIKPEALPAAFEDVKDRVVAAFAYTKRPFRIEAQAIEVQASDYLGGIVTPEKPRLLLNEATATGTVGDTVAKLTLTLSVEAIGRVPQERVLLPPDVSVTQAKPAAKSGVRILRDETGYLLQATAEGQHTVEIQYVARVEKKDKIRSVTVPLVPAATASTTLTLPGASVKVQLSPEVSYETKTVGQDTELTLYGAAVDKVTVSWEPKLEERDVEAVIFADQNAQLTVGRGVVRVETAIDYTVLQGKVDEFAVALPADATLLSVRGEGLRSWDVETQGANRVLKATLIDKVSDSYTLSLQVEQAVAKGALGQPATFAVPAIAAQGVERETGAVGILVWKGLKVEPMKTEGVTQVDVREMPPAFQKLKEQVHLAYRYLQRPFTIEAQVSEVEAKVSADVLTTVRVSPEALRFASTINYTIKDAGIFRFRIRLGKDVKLVDLQGENINNWERQTDELIIDLRSKAEGPYALTLETEQAIPQGTAESDVAGIELLEVARERGHLALVADPGIKIEPAGVEDIMQIDVRDLPKPVARKGAAPVPTADLAFRYLKHPYKLRIAISKIEAEVDATIHTALKVSEKNVEITSTLTYDIRKAGIFQLGIGLPAGFRLLGCDGQNIDDWKVAADVLTVALKQKTEGKYTLTLTGKQDVAKLDELPIPVFEAKAAEKETGYIAVRADESLRVKAAKTEGLVEIDVKELPPDLQKAASVLAFRYFAPKWTGTLAAEPIEPHVTAETFTFLSLGEALLQASVTIRYTILYAGVQTFKFTLPEGAEGVDIVAENIKHREEDKATRTWTITLQAKQKDEYKIFVTFQQKIDSEKVDLEYQGITVGDPAKEEKERLVKRETGYLAVAARSDLELAAGGKLKALTPIDPQEIPAQYKTGITAPLLLAFRYLQHPYILHAVARKHDPADVLVAIIEACLLNTTLTEDGNLITDMVCSVRNTREQNLAVALPPGSELWHVFVDGRRAIPVKSEESGVTWTKVPIAGVGDPMRAFVVQIRYGHTIEALGGKGVLALDFPKLAIPAMRLGWAVSLPEKYRLVAHAGTLRHVPYLDRELSVLAGSAVPVDRGPRKAAAQPIELRSRQMYQNVQVQDNLQQIAGANIGGRASGQRSIYTGSKPETANVHQFQSLIAMKDTGTIRSTYLRTSVDHVLQGVFVIVAIVAVFAFWFLAKGVSRSWRVGVLIAVALIILGIRTLSEDAWRQHITGVLWTTCAAAAVALVWDWSTAGWRAVRRRSAEPPSEALDPPDPEPPAPAPPKPEPPAQPEPEVQVAGQPAEPDADTDGQA